MKINPSLPNMIDPSMVKDYKNIVEMTSAESFYIWKEFQDDTVYETDSIGCGLNVGFVNDDQNMPIFVSINTGRYKGVSFLAWEATSRFVDYDVIKGYFKLHFPEAYHTNAMNIHNVR